MIWFKIHLISLIIAIIAIVAFIIGETLLEVNIKKHKKIIDILVMIMLISLSTFVASLIGIIVSL